MLGGLLVTLALLCVPAAAADRVLVFAAASMKDAVEAIAEEYREKTGIPVVVSLASSGILARQIEAGAPAGVFLSANPLWMRYLEERGLIEPGSRAIAAGNRLVIVRSAASQGGPETPETLLGAGRFAMGDPVHVPAGIYARAALERLGLWESVRRNAAFGENVRVAMAMVARGDVDAAIVYRSDAMLRDDLEIAYEFRQPDHLPIVYPVALTVEADGDARAFLRYLLERARGGALTRFGFEIPPEDSG